MQIQTPDFGNHMHELLTVINSFSVHLNRLQNYCCKASDLVIDLCVDEGIIIKLHKNLLILPHLKHLQKTFLMKIFTEIVVKLFLFRYAEKGFLLNLRPT